MTFVRCGDPPSGDLSVLRHSDLLYWVTFCSIMVTVPLFFVRWPREVRSDWQNLTLTGVYSNPGLVPMEPELN